MLPIIPFWCASAFIFVFRHEEFDKSTFWSSSFFALMGLNICLAGMRIHFRFAEKVQLSRPEKLIMGFSVLCVVCGLTLSIASILHPDVFGL